MVEDHLTVKMSIHNLRNKLVDNTKENFQSFNKFNLEKMSISKILASTEWNIISNINKDTPWICAKNCKS
jgi:hypothetical protein